MKSIILLIILIIVLTLIYYFYHTENFDETFEPQKGTFGEVLSKYNPYDFIDYSRQFDDVVVYNNDSTGRTGFDKCIEQCNGYCVEYGLTGDAHCYEVKPDTRKNFNIDIAQNDTNLAYPGIIRNEYHGI